MQITNVCLIYCNQLIISLKIHKTKNELNLNLLTI